MHPEDTAEIDAVAPSAASPEPAAQSPAPPSPPISALLQPGPEFFGRTFAFNLRDALVDLNFAVTPDVDAATFATMLVIAVDTDGRTAAAVATPEDPRNADEHATTMRARALAVAALVTTAN